MKSFCDGFEPTLERLRSFCKAFHICRLPSPPLFSDPFVRYSRTILDNFPLFSDTYVEETIINAWCCLAGTKHRCPKIRAASFFKKFH